MNIRWYILFALFSVLFLAVRPRQGSVQSATQFPKIPAPAGVSAESCLPCHEDVYETYVKTAHFRSTRLPSRGVILGSFEKNKNVLRTRKPTTFFEMVKEKDSFFQIAHWQEPGESGDFRSRKEKIAIVVGAGVEGQSYLYWRDGFLYQLPVSYLREPNDWINSPGFPDGEVFFGRPVTPRCMECHGTFFELTGTARRPKYRSNFQVGITCWKCHGDGGDHIAKYSGENSAIEGSGIINPRNLPTERQLEICALCHSGVGTEIRPNFTFRPGQELADYLRFDPDPTGASLLEPGGWLADKLFRQSKCFQGSPGTTCSTCHEVHLPEAGLAAKSKKCQQCHEVEACKMTPTIGSRIEDLCVECHMPDQESRRLRIHRTSDSVSPAYRNHKIAVYPEATRSVLERLGLPHE